MKKIFHSILIALTILIFAGCDSNNDTSNKKDESSGLDGSVPVISLERNGETKIDIKFTPTNNKKLPRIADIYIQYDPNAITFLGHEKGDAVKAAEKDIFIKNDDKKGVLRVTVLSAANLNRIADGIIASIGFRKNTEDETTVKIDDNRQIFAPVEANDQVSFGAPITL